MPVGACIGPRTAHAALLRGLISPATQRRAAIPNQSVVRGHCRARYAPRLVVHRRRSGGDGAARQEPGVSIADVVAVAQGHAPVDLTDAAIERMAASRAVVERLADSEPTYGVSTGFGALATVVIPQEQAPAAPGRPRPLPRRRDGAAGRGRGGAGDDVPTGAHAGARLQRSTAGDGARPRRSAQPRHPPGGARARLARRQR